ncbi:DUF5129 domain-containing protein [Corynebacterium fournieri]|uniref:DUF5129 domain-containing protein n=1 Tax=Corynebacterium fournieri TaxID=1852390 RepID=UPI000A2F1DB6|nr:DUF5129 domain-containing protein [Corynebacterium fournieri]WJY98609.1 hypothetical protein CFOUR_11155 [Corynebacterium fournieri]
MGMTSEIAAVLGISALVGLGGAAAAYTSVEIPERDQVAVQAVGAPSAVIDDPQDVLSPEDEQRLQRDTANINAPEVVKNFHYMVFETNHENILDDVEEVLRSQYPEMIDQSKGENGHMADGVLIVGVGMDPRQAFIYGGDDVTDELMLNDDSYREELLDAMKPGVNDGNIPSGLFRTANLAMDADGLTDRRVSDAESDREGAMIGLGMGGFGVSTAIGSGVVAVRNNRRKAIAKAREDYELVTSEYTRLAGRLDEVDVRANSLSSAFADETLRRQWAEVRDRFLGMNELVHGAQGLSAINMGDDKDVYKHRKQLADAAESVDHVSNAEDNIDRLFGVEHGDPATRRADLSTIREDVLRARSDVKDSGLRNELDLLMQRIEALDANPDSPTYLDDFIRVLGDYRVILDQVKKKQFSDVKEHEKLEAPAVYDSGFWYGGYVPYVHMHSWHESNVQAAQAASSSGGGSVSSSGFSAGGGSSSF